MRSAPRLLARGGPGARGGARWGRGGAAGVFFQTHARPDLADRWPEEILMTEHALLRNEAMAALARYEIQFTARQPFRTLSGGQQAGLPILLLELAGRLLYFFPHPPSYLFFLLASVARG